ncbi:MAG: 2-oxo acid dehydrogenase subunit E2 [Chloroflexi bacterium]|nr:2-oxo acid dehydrogenase subunit E2 [Chloroflexota bacterium]
MATNVVMPQLGESVVEGTVGKWFKKVGDKVDLYEPIFEVITDKVTTEVPSPSAGTLLQILVEEGATVRAGTMLAVIGAPGEKVQAAESAAKTQQQPAMVQAAQPTTATATPKSNGGTSQRLTPVVARMIAENNISDAELANIKGTGDGGRVSKKDIENFLKTRGQPSPQKATAPTPAKEETPAWEQPGTGELFRPSEEVFKTSPTTPSHPLPEKEAYGSVGEIVPLSPMRKAIAEHMVRSKHIAPHVTSVHEADMSRVIAYQKTHEADFAKQGVKLTFTAFFVQAAVAALKAWPIVNASYTEQGILMKRDINIGMAVAMEDGLIVPVIKHADDKSLLGTARMVNDLAKRAREKRLQPDEVQGGTFTITNYGIFGSLFGMPVINQPQSAIMGVGTIQKRVVVLNDAIAIRPMIYLSITIDHRLLDGAIGDQFMQKVKQFLEEHPAE